MTVVLDTSLLIRGYDPGDEPVAVSIISVGELRIGVLTAHTPDIARARSARLTAILEGTELLPVTPETALSYAALRAKTGRRPTNDLWIAATADAHRLKLLTADEPQSSLPIHAVEWIRAH